ncbi:MAG: alginate export family protein [Pseudomonadota bacterium]
MTVRALVPAMLGAIFWLTPPSSPSGRAAEAPGLEFDVSLRERATYLSALEWDADSSDAGWFWTQRLLLNTYWEGENASGKLTLLSALSDGIESSPIEENRLAIQEAYVDLSLGDATLRIGREELKFGSQRLVGWRDGTNVRRTFDSLRLTQTHGDWVVDTLYAQEVVVEPRGTFNDESSSGRSLAGVYATGRTALTSIDAYYLWSRRDERPTIEGTANQRRHTVGTRVFGDAGPLFWNWEAALQFGEHGDSDIRAWTLATNTGYRFDALWSPSIMLSANVSSGDSARDDGRLETFDALYPRGSYFSEIAQIGPSNFYNVNPYLGLQPREDIVISMDLNWFWRNELNDGVYGPPGNIVRLPQDSRKRLVSTAFSASIEWEATEKLFLGFVMTYSHPGAFIEDTGPSDNALFTEFSLEYAF